MKKIALILLLLIAAYTVAAAVFYVTSNSNWVANGTAVPIPISATVAAQTIATCVVGFNTAATFTVTAPGATFTSVATATNPGQAKAQLFIAENVPAGITQVTANSSVSQQFLAGAGVYSGLLTSGSLDQATQGTGNSNTWSAGPVTATASNEVIIGCGGAWNPGSIVADPLFIDRQHVNLQMLLEDRITTSGAYTATATTGTAQQWAMTVAALKGIVGPPPPPPPPPVPQWPTGYPSVDQYGGLTNLPANDGGSGWRPHKYGSRWLVVDPAGNGFFSFGVWNVANTGAWENQKYGSDAAWGTNTVKRLQSWGINTLWDHTYGSVRPDSANPQKMAASWFQDGASYPARNIYGFCSQGAKLISNGINQNFYGNGHYLAPSTDPYDPCFTTWHNAYFAPATAPPDLVNAMANSYIMGWSSGESDYMWGWGAGPDFPTVPPGHDLAHLGWMVLATAPTQSSGVVNGVSMPYADTTVYAKAALVTFLTARYVTIGALNTAWASTYTTFGSAGGWGAGTGILDEDGHHAWMGSSSNLAGETAAMKTDMNDFLFQYASKFFSVQRTALKTNYPTKIYFGPNVIGSWGTPPPRQILQAAALYADVLQTQVGSGAADDQARMDFVMQYYGDHPVMQWMGFPANPDSALCGSANVCTNPSTFLASSTQAQRGVNYNTVYTFALNYKVSGNIPGGAANVNSIIGLRWWAWQDSGGEATNWGLVTYTKGNAYNGVESVTGAVIDPWGFPAGGEAKNYGNFLGPGANTVINTHVTITNVLAGTPVNSILTVNSTNPASAVPITVTPNDVNGAGNGSTPFTRTYGPNISVTLVAPATAGGNNFTAWTGCDSVGGTGNLTCTKLSTTATVIANYLNPPPVVRTITVSSTNPASGVVIANSPADNNAHTTVVTSGPLLYNNSTAYTLTAPLTASGNAFSTWTNCTTPAANVCNDVATANKTITANYVVVPPTRILTVASANPTATTITVAPNCNGVGSIATPQSCTYNLGTSVTLTAPATSGGNNFLKWDGCDSVVGLACTIAVNGNTTVTVTYLSPLVTAVLSVASTNPASGVSITSVSPVCGGLGTITTPTNCTYAVPTSVSMIAPATGGGNAFLSWIGCDSVGGAGNQTCTVSTVADKTVTAQYAFTLAVNSTNPVSGTTIAYTPFNVNIPGTGSGSIITPGTIIFAAGVNATLTAPVTVGTSNFSSWTGCTSVLNQTCTVNMTASKTVTANYIGAGTGTFTCSQVTGIVVVSGKMVVSCKP